MQLSGCARCQDLQKERGGCALLSPPVPNKSKQGKEKIYHKTQDMNSTSDPESAVIISTQQQGRTLQLIRNYNMDIIADMELICTLLV